jgi:hypothetical protein
MTIEKAYLLYTNEVYSDLAELCVNSIKRYTDITIMVYGLNFMPNIQGAICIPWDCNINKIDQRHKFIDRSDNNIYKLLIERPKITIDALKYAKQIAYIDTDSIATPYIESIFDHFDNNSEYPFFVEGVYDYLHFNGRGGADSKEDLSTTLEAPICDLFNINQYVREKYRQTGYFVAGQNCINWLEEWAWMCQNPFILKNNEWFAPFHEETVANALLWKYKQYNGLPLIYINGLHKELEYRNNEYFLKDWQRVPLRENHLLYHGEKNINKINEFINYQNENTISSPAS